MDIKSQGLALVIGCLMMMSVPTSGIPEGYYSDRLFEGVCQNVPVVQNFSREQVRWILIMALPFFVRIVNGRTREVIN